MSEDTAISPRQQAIIFHEKVLFPLFGEKLSNVACSFPCHKSCPYDQDKKDKKYPHANLSKSCLVCAIRRARMIKALA